MVLSRYYYSQKKIYSQAGNKLIRVISQSLCEQRKILLFLSGGSNANLYGYLAGYLNHYELPLLSIAQIDERFQPNQALEINAEQIRKTGLWKVCGEKGIPYYIISQKGSVETASKEYSKTIENLWEKFDYIIAVLGIGEDCHTAGLIPGYEKNWNTDSYIAGYNLKHGKFRKRITITPKLMEKFDYALIVARGAKKKDAIKDALKKENLQNLNKYPAVIIQKIKEVDILTDIPVS